MNLKAPENKHKSGSVGSFLHSSSVYSFHLFLISSASTRSLPFLPFIVPSLGGMFPDGSSFPDELSCPSPFAVFFYHEALFTEEGPLVSSRCFLELSV